MQQCARPSRTLREPPWPTVSSSWLCTRFDTIVSDPIGLALLREDASQLVDVVGTSGSSADGSWILRGKH